MSKKDIGYALSANRWALVSFGFWSPPENKRSSRLIGIFAFFAMNILNGLTSIAQFIDLYVVWGNSYEVFDNLLTSVVLFVMQLKSVLIWTKTKQLGILFREIYVDWEREALNPDNLFDQELLKRREVMMSFARIGRIMSYTMTITMYSSSVLFLSHRYFQSVVFNMTAIERDFPYETEYLTNAVKYSPYYEIIYISQVVGGTLCVTTNFAADSAIAIVTLHICGQLKILANDFNNLADSVDKRKLVQWTWKMNVGGAKATLKDLVDRHLHLIDQVDIIEKTFSLTVLFQLIAASIVLSLISVFFIEALKNTDIIGIGMALFFLTSQTLFIFAYCFSGQQLYDQGVGIADAMYMSRWYNLPPDISKGLLLVRMRCYRRLSITAGKFCDMDYATFMTLLKTIGSYISLLRAVR